MATDDDADDDNDGDDGDDDSDDNDDSVHPAYWLLAACVYKLLAAGLGQSRQF